MRQIWYSVAASLDGYIAGPNGEYDWITNDPTIDFGELMGRFDTFLMGRGTYEMVPKGSVPGDREHVLVFSRTLRQEDHPDVTIVGDDIAAKLAELRAQPGKDIWLFGGGALFRSLLELGEVDCVEVGVIPVIVGGGIPFVEAPAPRQKLSLTKHKVYPSGIVMLEYSVTR